MNEDTTRCPLSWPANWPRTPYSRRGRAQFNKRVRTGGQWADGTVRTQKTRLEVGDGLDRLTGELRRLGARRVVISSNLRVTSAGLPYSKQAKQLDDPGVAVYFQLGSAPRALACDKWLSAAENMAAIAGHIEAIRAQGRYGVGTVEQAFAGYVGLPPKSDAWKLLGVERDATEQQISDAFKAKARTAHPDAVGDHDTMARLSAARDEALETARAMRR